MVNAAVLEVPLVLGERARLEMIWCKRRGGNASEKVVYLAASGGQWKQQSWSRWARTERAEERTGRVRSDGGWKYVCLEVKVGSGEIGPRSQLAVSVCVRSVSIGLLRRPVSNNGRSTCSRCQRDRLYPYEVPRKSQRAGKARGSHSTFSLAQSESMCQATDALSLTICLSVCPATGRQPH